MPTRQRLFWLMAPGLCLIGGCGTEHSAIDSMLGMGILLGFLLNVSTLVACLATGRRLVKFLAWLAGNIAGFFILVVIGLAFFDGLEGISYLIAGFFWGSMAGGMLATGLAFWGLADREWKNAALPYILGGLALSIPAGLLFPQGVYEDAPGTATMRLTLAAICTGAVLIGLLLVPRRHPDLARRLGWRLAGVMIVVAACTLYFGRIYFTSTATLVARGQIDDVLRKYVWGLQEGLYIARRMAPSGDPRIYRAVSARYRRTGRDDPKLLALVVETGGRLALPDLRDTSHTRQPVMRQAAAELLEQIDTPDSRTLLRRLLHDRDENVRMAATRALAGLGDPEGQALLHARTTQSIRLTAPATSPILYSMRMLGFNADGTRLLAVDYQQKVALWRVGSQGLQFLRQAQFPSGSYGPRYEPAANILVGMEKDGVVLVWSGDTLAPVRQISVPDLDAYTELAVSPDGRMLAATLTSNKELGIWNLRDGREMARIPLTISATSWEFVPGTSTVLCLPSYISSAGLYTVDAATRTCRYIPMPASGESALSPTQRIIAVKQHKELLLISLDSAKVLRRIPTSICSGETSLLQFFSPDGQAVLIAAPLVSGTGWCFEVYDVQSGAMLATGTSPAPGALSPGGRCLAEQRDGQPMARRFVSSSGAKPGMIELQGP